MGNALLCLYRDLAPGRGAELRHLLGGGPTRVIERGLRPAGLLAIVGLPGWPRFQRDLASVRQFDGHPADQSRPVRTDVRIVGRDGEDVLAGLQ